MSRLRRALIVGFLLSVLATGAATSATPALAKCQPYSNDQSRIDDGVYYYDGGIQTGTYGGVYASVYNYSPWVQPSSTTSAWTMLAEQSDYYAQVGWIECAGGGRYTFSQHTITPVVIGGKDNLAPQPVGVFTYYGTLWSPNTKVFTFQVNGGTVDQSPALSWAPGNAQAMGEIHISLVAALAATGVVSMNAFATPPSPSLRGVPTESLALTTVTLESPQEAATVSQQTAESAALARFPGSQVLDTVLAHARKPYSLPDAGQLCWVVSIARPCRPSRGHRVADRFRCDTSSSLSTRTPASLCSLSISRARTRLSKHSQGGRGASQTPELSDLAQGRSRSGSAALPRISRKLGFARNCSA